MEDVSAPPPPPLWPERHAAVVGTGIAGATVAERLARLGWRVTLIESRPFPGGGGSGQPVVADHLHLSPDDNQLARLTRAALLLRDRSGALSGERIGRLAIAATPGEAARQREMIERLNFPTQLVSWLNADEASDQAGCRLALGGLWIPGSTVAEPGRRIAELLTSAGDSLTWVGSTTVASVSARASGSGYRLMAVDGSVIAEAPVVVLCDAGPRDAFVPAIRSLNLRRVRGQTSWVAHPALSGLRTVLGGAAYAVPIAGRVLTGSTYDEFDSTEPDPEADRSNARRLAPMLGLHPAALESATQPAALGFRWTAPDRLPLVGLMPDEDNSIQTRDALLRNDRLPIARRQGIYCVRALGSRGLLWSILGAELIAAWLSGAPIPLARDLLDAIDPARGVRAMLRRGGIRR